MRIAYFSPLRPVASGISDYSEELLPALAQAGAEITVFVDGYEPTNLLIRRQFPIHDYRDFDNLHRDRPFDIPLYHMGNHICHAYIYEMMQRHPGVVVLHDTVLQHFLGAYLTQEGDVISYLENFSEGEGLSLIRRREAGIWSHLDHFLYPGIRRVVESNYGVIVHSETARQAVLRAVPTARVSVVRHHLGPLRSPYAGLPPAEIKTRLGYYPETFLVVSPGIVTPSRRIEALLDIFATFSQVFPHSRCAIVGPDHPEVRIADHVRRFRLDGLIRVTGFVDVPTFQSYILAADVVVNLRYPLAGETSGGLIRALGAGKPVLLSNVGQYAEFPDDCCLKVDLGKDEEEMALTYLDALVRDPALGQRIGGQARRYIQTYHALERSAQGYLNFIRSILKEKPPFRPGLSDEENDVACIMEEIRREVIRQQWSKDGDRSSPVPEFR